MIAELNDDDPNLVRKLTDWANHFRYEEISTFIQQHIRHDKLPSSV